jgi:hypothetical protein
MSEEVQGIIPGLLLYLEFVLAEFIVVRDFSGSTFPVAKAI